jgi:hypothetical protein
MSGFALTGSGVPLDANQFDSRPISDYSLNFHTLRIQEFGDSTTRSLPFALLGLAPDRLRLET